MPVVKGGHQTDAAALEHAVAEDIAGHVPDPDHPQRVTLGVHSERPEMPLHRQPRAPGGYAESLVVITVTAAGREGVPKPITLFRADAVGEVGERPGALVRGDHEVGVVTVPAHHPFGAQHFFIDQVVGHVEQGADESAISAPTRLGPFGPVPGLVVEHEGSFGPGRHDQCVFLDLGPGQAQYLSAQVSPPVAPSDPTPGHGPNRKWSPSKPGHHTNTSVKGRGGGKKGTDLLANLSEIVSRSRAQLVRVVASTRATSSLRASSC